MTTQLALFSTPAPPPPPPRVVERYGWRWRVDHTATNREDRVYGWLCEPAEGVLAFIGTDDSKRWDWAVFGLGKSACGEAESKKAAEEAAREAVRDETATGDRD